MYHIQLRCLGSGVMMSLTVLIGPRLLYNSFGLLIEPLEGSWGAINFLAVDLTS